MKFVYIFLCFTVAFGTLLSAKIENTVQFNDKLANVDLLYENSLQLNREINEAKNNVLATIYTDLTGVFNASSVYADQTLDDLMTHITYINDNHTKYSTLLTELTPESSCKVDLVAALEIISNLAGLECALVFREFSKQSELELNEFLVKYFNYKDIAQQLYDAYGYKNLIVVDSNEILQQLTETANQLLDQLKNSLDSSAQVIEDVTVRYEKLYEELKANFDDFDVAFVTSLQLFERAIVNCEKFDNIQYNFNRILPKFKLQRGDILLE